MENYNSNGVAQGNQGSSNSGLVAKGNQVGAQGTGMTSAAQNSVQPGSANSAMSGMSNQNTSASSASAGQANTQNSIPGQVVGQTKTQGQAQQGQGTTQAIMQGAFGSVVASFSSHNQAVKAADQLRQSGFTTEEINVVAKKSEKQGETDEFYNDDVTDGVLTGGTLGGIGGLLAGAGAMLIPGVGPIVAAGPIAAALSGAVAGGVAGGLIDYGIPAEASTRYEEKVARGESITLVKTSLAKVNQASQILRQNGATEVEVHEM